MRLPHNSIKFKKTEQRLKHTKEQLLQTKEHLLQTKNQLLQTKEHLLQTRERLICEHKARKQAKRLRKQVRKAHGNQHWYKRQQLLPILKHLLPMWIIGLLLVVSTHAKAQILERVFSENFRIDTIPEGSLRAEVDAVAFFHDNEYQSSILDGYSLPGIRLTPHLAFNPLKQVNIEAGASMLFYNGANKYPCYAYHDIGTWKGNQYQSGCHVLPWVRLQASLKHLDVVVGNIYGGSNHKLTAPMFNAEQNLSADPEMGAQILVHRKHFVSDTWLNWQSYIFELDSHQEAFTVGESMRILWGKTDQKLQWFTPIQVTIQHRGGEQDTTAMGVQTFCNASVGIGCYIQPIRKNIDYVSGQLAALASYQQSGHYWPFDTGFALHVGAEMGLLKHLHLAADYFQAPKQYANLFGNPFFGTMSLADKSLTFKGMKAIRAGVGYEYIFAKAYTLGAHAELFCLNTKNKSTEEKVTETNFSFGLYFRVSPSFLIKRF